MVKGRVVLLVVTCLVLYTSIILERAIGLPVVTFLLFPILYAVLPDFERVVLFLFTSVVLAILFLLTIPEAALCLAFPIIAERVVVRDVNLWKIFNKSIATIASVCLCAVLSGVPFSEGLLLYASVSMIAGMFVLRKVLQRVGQMYQRSVVLFA